MKYSLHSTHIFWHFWFTSNGLDFLLSFLQPSEGEELGDKVGKEIPGGNVNIDWWALLFWSVMVSVVAMVSMISVSVVVSVVGVEVSL